MTSNTEKMKILIVEDEVLIAADLAFRLKGLGYTVCGKATSAEKALDLVGQYKPDLVMMDIVLKGAMDGIDAAEVIRDKWCIPVIFLTAYADSDRLERAKLTYPFGFILKPFQDRDLKITMEMALYVGKVDSDRRKAEEALRESEAKLKNLFKMLPIGISILNEKQDIVFMNPSLGRILKISQEGLSRGDYRQRTYINGNGESMSPENFPSTQAFRENKAVYNVEIGVVIENGSFVWTNVSALPHSSLDWKVIIVTTDITDRKQAEESLQNSLKEKENLLQEVHHRVKNNMQVIISLMKLQSNQMIDDNLKNAFIESQNRVYAMSAVHETLHQSENFASVDLAAYLSKLSETSFQTYRTDSGNIQFHTDIQPIEVNFDASYSIGLVFNELLSNSLKYAFPEGRAGKILISGEHIENTMKLVISDDGVGMPDEFDWKNADSLGLQIVRTLIEDQLYGTIKLDVTHGTKWTITFPA